MSQFGSIYDITSQFTKIDEFLNKDFLAVDKTTYIPTGNQLFKLLNTLENRNVMATRPVLEQRCYSNEDFWWHANECTMVPKIISYMDNDGNMVNQIVTGEYISSNSWVMEIEQLLDFSTLKNKSTELKNITLPFFEKIYKYGNDYVARADMIDKYICNCMDSMIGIGNVYLHLGYKKFFEPTYTQSYLDGDGLQVPSILIKEGLIANNLVMNYNHGFLQKYIIEIENYITLLNNFVTTVENLRTTDPTLAEEKVLQFFTLTEFEYKNYLDQGTDVFSYIKLKLLCNTYISKINDWLDDRIDLLNTCTYNIDHYENILKIISTIAITLNVSPKANKLQNHINQGYDIDANKYYNEIATATRIAFDYKNFYPPQKLGEAITIATRKALNTFGYFN